METPVIVGVMIALMFLVIFSEWFYNLSKGLSEVVIDDQFYGFRVFVASLLSIGFVVGMFFLISVVNKCPKESEERVGIFSSLNCDGYLELKAATEIIFKAKDQGIDEPL